MSDFEIKRDSNIKKLPVFSLDENDNKDTITTSRKGKEPDVTDDLFFSKTPTKPNLGMEFLVEQEEEQESESDEEEEPEQDQVSEVNEFLNEPENFPEMTYSQIQEEKAKGLSQLKRFQKRGIPLDRHLGMEHSLAEIQGEVYRIKKENQVDAGIDYCRQGLLFCVSSIEMANKTYKIGGELDGWSQVVFNDITTYDDVFEELYEKYYSKMSTSPEVKLISMLAGSAFMFHLQKKLAGHGASMGRRQREMSGPSADTDDMLRSLNEDSESEESESVISEEPEPEPEPEVKNININPEKKGRGRPKKVK